jgi:aldehyde dehydrogenase (NAD+)
MLDKRKFYINGEWVAPVVANDLEVLNPATEKPIAVISMGSAGDIDRAVAAAKKAFATYSRTSTEERLALLEKLLSIYKRRYEEMAQTITMELGAPITMSTEQQADVGVGHLQGFIELADQPDRAQGRPSLGDGFDLRAEALRIHAAERASLCRNGA